MNLSWQKKSYPVFPNVPFESVKSLSSLTGSLFAFGPLISAVCWGMPWQSDMEMLQGAFHFSQQSSKLMSLERNPGRSTGALQEESLPAHPRPPKEYVYIRPASRVRRQPDASVIETGPINDFRFNLLLKSWKTLWEWPLALREYRGWGKARHSSSSEGLFLDQQFPQDPLRA